MQEKKPYNWKSWKGRSLSNYKKMHADIAREKGLYDVLMQAQTLTSARKILFGVK